MSRQRGENLRLVYVLAFLHIAFFFLEYQDPQRYASLFAFDRTSVAAGQLWRLVTYQFVAGQGWFAFARPLALFISLVLLTIMGSALEEEWGSLRFASLFAISTLTSAGVAALLGVPLLGSFFLYFSLLFVYATAFPRNTLLLFNVMPIRFRWVAFVVAAVLLSGVVLGGRANIASLAGALASLGYYALNRINPHQPPMPEERSIATDSLLLRNAARSAGIKKAVSTSSAPDVARLLAQCEIEIVQGVNICPPADYKPEGMDGYCIRCEGFAECSARHLRALSLSATPTA